jgi:DNA-binding NarL/FixJ family response regulator
MIETVGIAAALLVMIIVLIFSYIKDLETKKKLAIYESSIEDINKRVHLLQKSIKKENPIDLSDIEEKIECSINEKTGNFAEPILEALQKIEESMLEFQRGTNTRIEKLEERIREVTSISPISPQSNEKTIISMYKEGISENDIAKDLRISIAEVGLVLKIAGLK